MGVRSGIRTLSILLVVFAFPLPARASFDPSDPPAGEHTRTEGPRYAIGEIELRYAEINAFEKMLTQNGTKILKFMLHISKEEQAERLRDRIATPEKRWKFNPGDLEDRKLWDDYQAAYETVLQRCSTPWAPWYVVPADSRSRRDAIAARLIRAELEAMKPEYPDPGYRPEQYQID